jgi:uncharacterized delta-60 repeat protein
MLTMVGAARAQTIRSLPSESWQFDAAYGDGGVAEAHIGTKPVEIGSIQHVSNDVWRITTQPDGGTLLLLRESLIYRVNADGSMDHSFGRLGHIVDAVGRPLLFQTDSVGRLYVTSAAVVPGRCYPNPICHSLTASRIRRYTAAGQPDLSYGDASFGTTVFESVEAAKVMPDGTVLLTSIVYNAACSSSNSIGLAISRMHSNGTLDATVGTAGFQIICGAGYSSELSQNPDGTLLLRSSLPNATSRLPNVQRVQRLTRAGILDSMYGNEGAADVPSPMQDALFLGDGAFIAITAGSIVRITPQGKLDTTGFGPVPVALPGPPRIPPESRIPGGRLLAVAPNGYFYIQIESGDQPLDSVASAKHLIYRLTPAGALDASWGSGGVYTSNFHLDPQLIAVRSNGDLLVPSSTTFIGIPNLLRLTAVGVPAAGFGTNGSALIAAREESRDCVRMAEVQTTGALIASGETDAAEAGSTQSWVLARFSSAGALDTRFGQSGTVRTALPLHALTAVLADDKIALYDGLHLIRLDRDGQPDATFGGNPNGAVTLTLPSAQVGAGTRVLETGLGSGGPPITPRSLIGDDSGRITFVGQTRGDDIFDSTIIVGRTTQTGTLDTRFGMAGFLVFSNTAGATVDVITAERDGRIAALIRMRTPMENSTVLRVWNASGQIDASFGVMGVVTLSLSPIFPVEHAAVVAPAAIWQPRLNRLVNGAWLVSNAQADNVGGNLPAIVIRRITAQGKMDASYGVNGAAQLPYGSNVWFDDEIGQAYFANSSASGISFRLDANGSIDRGFGMDGRSFFPLSPWPNQSLIFENYGPTRFGYQPGSTQALYIPDCSANGFNVRKMTLKQFNLYRVHLPIAAQAQTEPRGALMLNSAAQDR